MDTTAMRSANPAVLPRGYGKLFTLNLQKDKKAALLVNGISLSLMLFFGVLGHLVVPVSTLFDMTGGLLSYLIRFALLLGGMAAYIVLHELVHGVCMAQFSGVRPSYGFTGMYAYAGSTAYFSRTYYIIIALAPIVVWGIVLQVICAITPASWFWIPWFIQVTNLSGAAGDLYVTWRFTSLPADILINDTGVEMTVFGRQTQA